MPRGPKPKPKNAARKPLTARAPSWLPDDAQKAYRALAKDLIAEGFAGQADWRTVALAAETQAAFERLSAEVAGLKTLTTLSASGERLNPIVSELRAVRNQLAAILAQLLLTPRSRSASRMTEAQARSAAAKTDDMEEFLGG